MNNETVSFVVPGRNCASTIRQCLSAVVPLLEHERLGEIIFVDDGSTDGTGEIVAEFPVRCVPGGGRGPGAARNLGWREARCPVVWFVDSDCVAEPDALELLLVHLADSRVGAVSGSYGIMNPESLLACLIHEEIIQRHLAMPPRVNFLATFNVIYRRAVLEQLGGFDEQYLKAQDAELSYRAKEAGYELAFERESRVKHYHATRWLRYLRTQRQQGYWRVWLHSRRGRAAGDDYSNIVDHMQPPLAMAVLASLVLVVFPYGRWVPAGLFAVLAVAQLPMTCRLLKRLRRPRYALFVLMGLTRSFWRGAGMVQGAFGYLWSRFRRAR